MPRISLLFLVLCLTAIRAVFSFPIDGALILAVIPFDCKPELRERLNELKPGRRGEIIKLCKGFSVCLSSWGSERKIACRSNCVLNELKKDKTPRPAAGSNNVGSNGHVVS